MPIETIEHNGNVYPAFQASGNAARFAKPFFDEFCKGNNGLEVGCNRKEWAFNPDSDLADPAFNGIDGLALPVPDGYYDWIANSHVIEHLPNVITAIEHWHSKIKPQGILFMYIPNMDRQSYWQPNYNRKHIHYLTPAIMRVYFTNMVNDGLFTKFFISDTDLNSSFVVVAEKGDSRYSETIQLTDTDYITIYPKD